MSREIPQAAPGVYVTGFCGGPGVGLPSPGRPSYQIDAPSRAHIGDSVVMTELEAETVCKAILKDIRQRRAEREEADLLTRKPPPALPEIRGPLKGPERWRE